MNEVWFISYVVLWLVVLASVCTIAVLARQIGVLHMRLGPAGARVSTAGPEIGTLAPKIDGIDVNGNPFRFGEISDKRTLLVFISPQCSTCADLAPSIKALAKNERAKLNVVLVSVVDDVGKTLDFVETHGLRKTPCVVSRQALDWTPRLRQSVKRQFAVRCRSIVGRG